MSWRTKTQLVQNFMSVKRQLDFVPHGQMMIIDRDLTGRCRFCKKMDGDYVGLVSDLEIPASNAINVGDTEITVDGWITLPHGSLLSLGGGEFIVAKSMNYTRDVTSPTSKITTLYLEVPVQRSYSGNTIMRIVGFPMQLVGPYDAGASALMFDTLEMAVPGDYFASFHYEDSVPVLDAWQQIQYMEDKTEFADADGLTIRRYYALMAKPLQKSLDASSTVFIKALPAYQSHILPVEIGGAFHVDAFTGKTFGTGSDNLSLSVTLYDANKEVTQDSTTKTIYEKNDVLVVSSFGAEDFTLWDLGAGTITLDSANSCVFTLDASGHFSIGLSCTKQQLSFRTKFACADEFKLKIRTSNQRQTSISLSGHLAVALSEVSDHVIFDIVGVPYSRLNVSNDDASSRVSYIAYSYCPNIDSTERWEGSSLVLKPTLLQLDNLYSGIDDLVLDSGVLLQ